MFVRLLFVGEHSVHTHKPPPHTQEQERLNCVGCINNTQAGRAPLQLAQSKAGWINWSGSCANEVRSLLSPLVLLGRIISAHLS